MQIKSLFGEVLYKCDADTIRECVVGAYLSGSSLIEADLSGCIGLPDAPLIEHLDARIHKDVTDGFVLDMTDWHTCDTTHCRAGHAIRLAGKAGEELEKRYGPCVAGALIYTASRPGRRVPNFHSTDEAAMADIRACAEEVV